MDFEPELRIVPYQPGDNVKLWLHRLNTERTIQQWPDAMAVRQASLLMGDIPLTWLISNCNSINTWADFESAVQQRFGDSEQTIMARIYHRKQGQEEPVQSYFDDMHLLFAQATLPDALKRDALLQNLKPSLRKRVILSIPNTKEDVMNNAIFLERKLCGETSADQIARQQPTTQKLGKMDRLTRAMDRMSLGLQALTQQY